MVAYTLKECREGNKSRSDLKGGMNVILEVSVQTFEGFVGINTSEIFTEALKTLNCVKQNRVLIFKDFPRRI